MNEKTSWDHSLVKKYSSSNHFKMLNQLRNEVIKYPLIKRKNISSKSNIENKIENNNKENTNNSKDLSLSYNSNINREIDKSKSTVSFNNSKDFSIYNNIKQDQDEIQLLGKKKANDEKASSTFKDRLNKIDLK